MLSRDNAETDIFVSTYLIILHWIGYHENVFVITSLSQCMNVIQTVRNHLFRVWLARPNIITQGTISMIRAMKKTLPTLLIPNDL